MVQRVGSFASASFNPQKCRFTSQPEENSEGGPEFHGCPGIILSKMVSSVFAVFLSFGSGWMMVMAPPGGLFRKGFSGVEG